MSRLAPFTNADVLRGILVEEQQAQAAAENAADHHRFAGLDETEGGETTRRTLYGRYLVLAEVHRRRVGVLERLLDLDVAMPPMPTEGAENIVYLQERRR